MQRRDRRNLLSLMRIIGVKIASQRHHNAHDLSKCAYDGLKFIVYFSDGLAGKAESSFRLRLNYWIICSGMLAAVAFMIIQDDRLADHPVPWLVYIS